MSGCRISSEWTFKGMRTLILENESLRVVILLDKGSDIIEILYKPLDVDFMWHSPIGYRNPATFIASCPPSTGSFMDYYGGGWQDILPVAGRGIIKHRGAEWGVHGETALIPWDCVIEEKTSKEVAAHLSVECYRYPFRVDKWIRMEKGTESFTIQERLTNLSEQELEFSWLQHPSFSEPFITPGGRIDIPAETVLTTGQASFARFPQDGRFKWPVVPDRNGEQVDLREIPRRDIVSGETLYITGLREGWYAITNPQLNLGFGLTWDKDVYPYVWYWQNFNLPNYPYFGRAWNIALEPCTSYPGFAEQMKSGNTAKISGKASIEVTIKAMVYTGLRNVDRITMDGTVEGEESRK